MTVLKQLTDQETEELLSASLDGRLSPTEQIQLDSILAADPDMRTSLATLRYTRHLLAEAPRVAVPRPFTLNETMLGITSEQRVGWLAWLTPLRLRGAAAIVAVLMVVLLAGGVIAPMLSGSGPASLAALEAPSGGLARDQGNPTGILAAKTPTEAPDAAPPLFLGLTPPALAALEVALALLLVLLLVASWRLTPGRA